MRPHIPNMEELLNQKSNDTSKVQTETLCMSMVDLEYAYRQSKLSEKTSRQCKNRINGGNMNGNYRLKKNYGLSDIPTKFQIEKRPNIGLSNSRAIRRY